MTSEHKNEYLFLSRTVKQKTTKQITYNKASILYPCTLYKMFS